MVLFDLVRTKRVADRVETISASVSWRGPWGIRTVEALVNGG